VVGLTEYRDADGDFGDVGDRRQLVGRAGALADVETVLDEVGEGVGRTLLVTGETGAGKTALLSALSSRARKRGFAVFEGAAQPDVLVPFAPVARAFEAGDAGTGVPGYLRSPSGPVPEDPESFTAQRSGQFHDVADELRAMGTIDPVVVVLDDLQWADPASLALFEHFAAEILEFPVLVAGATCPPDAAEDGDGGPDVGASEVGPGWTEDVGPDVHRATVERVAGLDRTTVVELGPLGDAGTASLVGSQLDVEPPPAFVELVASATGGSPALVVETLALWRETGVVDPASETYPTDADDVAVPPDAEAAVARRVERLPADQRRVLAAVAVLGRGSRSLLADVLEGGLPDGEPVDALVAAGLLETMGVALAPTSSAVRSAALAAVSDERRRAVAERAAGAVEAPGAAAHHHERAGTTELAVERYVAAAEQAGSVIAPRVAAEAHGRARAVAASAGWVDRAHELALAEGRDHLVAGDIAAAGELFETVRASVDDPEVAARACTAAARLHRHESDLDAAVRLADEGLALADDERVPSSVRRALLHVKGGTAVDAGDLATARDAFEREVEAATGHGERAEALTDRAVAERLGGQLGEARSLLVAAVEHAETAGDDEVVARAVRKLAVVDDQIGDVESAIEEYRQLIARLKEQGDVVDLPTAMMNLGACYYNLGRIEEAFDRFESGMEMARRIDREDVEGLALGNLGLASVVLGDREAAVDYCERGIAILESLGRRDRVAMRRVTLGFAHFLGEETERAMETVDEAVSVARDAGQKYALGYSLKFRGRFRRATGDVGGAVEDHEESVAVMADLGNVRHEADARVQLALDHLADGRPDDALATAEGAFGSAYELGHPLLVARIGARLGRVRRERGDLSGAAAALDGARVRQRDRCDVQEETWTLLELARLARDREDPERAHEFLDRATVLAEDAGFERYRRVAERLRETL
jgi:tetratricopeptide (TPR) repeat protein